MTNPTVPVVSDVSELASFSSLQAPAKASAIELYARPSKDFAAKLDEIGRAHV